VSENAFGILAQTFINFLKIIKSSPENVDYIISAACVLHSFIRQRDDKSANQTNTVNDEPSGTDFKFFTASRRKSNRDCLRS
jgi:hypothetical protein